MRCLYCGIKLKIAAQAKLIHHCPECSLRVESEGRRAPLAVAEDRKRSVIVSDSRRPAAFAATGSA